MYELGKYYLTNNDDPENNAEATQWLTGAAQRGRIEAIFLLAEMYLYGTKYIAKMKIMRCTGTKKRRV